MSADDGFDTINTEGPVYECVKCARRVPSTAIHQL
jgi:hypothetical protein